MTVTLTLAELTDGQCDRHSDGHADRNNDGYIARHGDGHADGHNEGHFITLPTPAMSDFRSR